LSIDSVWRNERWMPALFVVLWATGFISAKYGLPYAPPAKFLVARFGLVILLMIAVATLARAPWPADRRQTIHIAIAGVLLQSGYLYGVFGAIDAGMSAGLISLMVALQPILTAFLAALFFRESVTALQWLGLVLGLGGTALVLADKMHLSGLTVTALMFALLGLLGITFGTLYQKRYCGAFDLRTGSVIQFVAATIVLLPFAWREPASIEWTSSFVFALGWVVLVMSIAAISLLTLLIRRGTATRVTSMFYLVPPITAIMAFALFGESLSATATLGMALTVAGVALVMRSGLRT
jgi:drug/metabolite transporter (DMT)-like permease